MRKAWGQGFAVEAARAVQQVAAAHLGAPPISLIAEHNLGSIKVAETVGTRLKAGFSSEAIRVASIVIHERPGSDAFPSIERTFPSMPRLPAAVERSGRRLTSQSNQLRAFAGGHIGTRSLHDPWMVTVTISRTGFEPTGLRQRKRIELKGDGEALSSCARSGAA